MATRVANIRDGSGSSNGNNGSVFLAPGQTVFDDSDPDVLSGGLSTNPSQAWLDWFFVNQSQDTINDFENGEFLDVL